MSLSNDAYSEMHIKGGLLRSRFLFIALHHGTEAWQKILERLSEEEQQALAEIDIEAWYPLSVLDDIDRAIAEDLDGKPVDIFTQLGEFSATSSLAGPWSSLVNPDIHSFLNQSALIHRAYQDFGSASYDELSEVSGILKINYDIAPPQSFCLSGTAYFRRAIEYCGARSASVTHTRCCGRGDTVCEFYCTWQA